MAEHADPEASPLRRGRRRATAATTPTSEPVRLEVRSEEPASAPAVAPAVAPADEPAAAPRRGRPTRRFWAALIAASLVLGAIVGLVAAYAVRSGTPTYESRALLDIDQPTAVALSSDDGVLAKLSRLRYKYAGLVRTRTFTDPVAQQLNVDPGVVASSVFALVDPNSLLLAVGARGSDANRTATIADAAAHHLVQFARDEQTADQIPGKQQVTFSIVTSAGPAAKVAPTEGRALLVGFGAAVFVALGTAGFGYLWRRDS